MSEGEERAVFLGRRSYASRRRADAARLLPVLGAFLVILPVLFGRGASISSTLIYLFCVWIGLIAATALLSRRLRGEDGEEGGEEDGGPP